MQRETGQRTRIRKSLFGRRLILLVFIAIALMIFSACAPAATEAPAAPEEPAVPEAPAATEAPPEGAEPAEEFPVQYGQDTRMEPFQHPDRKLIEMADSVAIFAHKDQVELTGNEVTLKGYTLNDMSELGWLVSGAHVPMCANELFASQPAPGYCTGFLVAEDMIVTAGHCLVKTPCADTRVVFEFQMESTDALATMTRNDLFECAEVITQVLPNEENGSLDYALIRLDRPTGRVGLAYTTSDHLQAQDNVAVLGYPSGLPLKIASNAVVMDNNASSPYFVANLDTFGSNSGSPVINLNTYQVEGILVRGITDYILSEDGSCVQVNRCPESGNANCAGENATKMGRVAGDISKWLAEKPGGWSCGAGLLMVFTLLVLARVKGTS